MSTVTPTATTSTAHKLKNFGLGGLSGMVATTFVQPIDIIKVRLQIQAAANTGQKIGPLVSAKELMKKEGPKGFYRGYDAAIMRQAFYTTARFGIFLNLSDYIKHKKNGGENLSFAQKGGCSLAAGGLGSIVGTPADLILIRMQNDSTLPAEQRRNYTSVFNAMRRIPSEEGVLSLWKGGFPTMVRAMALNLGMFTTYEESKERLTKAMPNNQGLAWLISGMFAGGVAATMSLPFDNAKTKLQSMKPDAEGKLPYKNIFDAMGKTISQDGPAALWVGLPTFVMRIAPHVIITMLCSEKLKKLLL